MELTNKKIVITGGAGFIGSNLAHRLSKNNDVIVIDDLSSGKTENIQNLVNKNKIKFVNKSITDYSFLKKTFKNIDIIFHEAAIASVPQSFDNPIKTNKVNIDGTVNVFRAASENNVRKVVWASSCAIYGNPDELPLKEETAVNPVSPYAISKLAGEYYADIFTKNYGLPIVSLRYFNVYGPRQDPMGDYAAVIPIFIKKLLESKPLSIFGDGKQTRDFVFIDDVIRANLFMAENDAVGVYNVGIGRGLSINDLASVLQEISGMNVNVNYVDKREGEVKFSFADSSKLKNLGFCFKNNFMEGLKKTFDWYKKFY